MGTANGMYAEAVTDVLKKIPTEAGNAMVNSFGSKSVHGVFIFLIARDWKK